MNNEKRRRQIRSQIADIVIVSQEAHLPDDPNKLKNLVAEYNALGQTLPVKPGAYELVREGSYRRYATLGVSGWEFDGAIYPPAGFAEKMRSLGRVPERLYTQKEAQVMAQALAIQAVEYAATRDPT